MVSSSETGILNAVRRLMPGSKYRAEATIRTANVSVGTVLKTLVGKFPNSQTSVEGETLIVSRLDKSLNLGFVDSILRVDRSLRDINARISVAKTSDSLTITADVQQGWSRWAAMLLLGILIFVGWAILLGGFLKVTLVTNGKVKSQVQGILDDVANEITRNAALERLS